MMYSQDLRGEAAKNNSLRADGFKTTGFGFIPNTLSASAIKQFFDGKLTVCECHTLMMAVYFRALLDLLGEGLFNKVFFEKNMTLYTGSGMSLMSPPNPWQGLMRSFQVAEDASNVQAGDWVYFTNHPGYKERHPGGAAAGWNVICVSDTDERRYMGFGLTNGAEPEDMRSFTGPELCDILLGFHNAPPDEHDKAFKKAASKGLTGDVDLTGLSLARMGMHIASLKPHLDTQVKGKRLNVTKLQALKGT